MLARLALISALLATFAFPAGASAAARHVPRGWLGVNVDGPFTDGPYATASEWNLLAGSGAESVRIPVRWAFAQPTADLPPDLSATDRLVLEAARRRLSVLPVVADAPSWAATDPSDGSASPPRDPAEYGAFLQALVARYGPRGSLWTEHPEVRRAPIRDWQVWNEPNLAAFWTPQRGWPRAYVRLLRVARRALRGGDPHARVVLAGLTNRSWSALRRIYDAGGRGLFDVVTIHPYTGKPRNVVATVRLVRRVMRRHRNNRLPVWITEMSWPAGLSHGRPYVAGFETTEHGQQARLRKALPMLARVRRRLRIEHVYWYSWLSDEQSGQPVFAWSGLRRVADGRVRSAGSLAVFRAAARRLEGR